VRELFSRDVHAAIDLSDGLSSEAAHLSRASGVALVLDPACLPPTPSQEALAVRLGRDPMEWILHGGEDHSLLAAVSPEAALPADARPIGLAESGSGVFLERGRARVPLEPGGWSHR
jgi:thiamine-monophosphate kinase